MSKDYIQTLKQCIHERDVDQLEKLLEDKPLANQEYIDCLNIILTQSWHYSHETIAGYLQLMKSPTSVDALLKTAQMKFEYLEYDNSEALARKCTWALADIGTDLSKSALKKLSDFKEPQIASYARKRVDNWEAEIKRKGNIKNPSLPDYYFLDQYKNKPWLVWLIICLCRQRKRQEWLGEIHNTLSKLELPRKGQVPDLNDWTYRYHGMGLCLYGPNEEALDVDFHDNDVNTIDPYFFASRVTELTPAPLPEQRLLRWIPDESLIYAAIKILQAEGILSPAKSHVFKLSHRLEEIWKQIAEIDFSNHQIFDNWIRQLEATEPNTQYQEVNDAHINWLEELLTLENKSNSLFGGVLKALPDDKQLALCKKCLNEPISHSTAQAVEALHRMKNPPVQEVLGLLKRLKPQKHHPFIAWQSCHFLLDRDIEKERCIKLIVAFSNQRIVKGYGGNPYDYELAYLCLIHDPKTGIKLLRRALRSKTPYAINQAAALMAAIDKPWCHYELEMALKTTPEDGDTTSHRYLAAAMIFSSNPNVQNRGKQLIPPSRVRTENDIGYTYDEVVEASMDDEFPDKVEEARKDLMQFDLKAISEAWAPIDEKELNKETGLFTNFLNKTWKSFFK